MFCPFIGGGGGGGGKGEEGEKRRQADIPEIPRLDNVYDLVLGTVPLYKWAWACQIFTVKGQCHYTSGPGPAKYSQ